MYFAKKEIQFGNLNQSCNHLLTGGKGFRSKQLRVHKGVLREDDTLGAVRIKYLKYFSVVFA
jgi:hypothetical protein